LPDHKIVSLDPGKFESARDAINLAFFEDPVMKFMQADPAKRMKTGSWMFGSMIKYAMRWGVVDTDESGRAVAVWLPPGGTTIPFFRLIRSPLIQAPFRLGLRGFLRFGRVMGETDKVHERLVPGPHWYLMGIGVHPDLQGTGIGSALMNRGHERADAGDHPIYLETATEEDIAFYSKRKYDLKESLMIEDLKATLMVRPNKSSRPNE